MFKVFIFTLLMILFSGMAALGQEIGPPSQEPPTIEEPPETPIPSPTPPPLPEMKSYGSVRIGGSVSANGFDFPAAGYGPPSTHLQGGAGSDSRIFATYLYGSQEGPLLGLVYVQGNMLYGKENNGVNTVYSFNSNEYLTLVEAGYWLKLKYG